MQNQEEWKPSRFVYKGGKLSASRDGAEVSLSSRLIVDIVAGFYDRNLKQHARGRLLDLGCGKVPLYATYRELVTDAICVDWGNTEHKNRHLDRELDLTNNLPFRDDEFDTIILSDVLEHIPVPEHLWKEMARILSKNGKIIMNVPFFIGCTKNPTTITDIRSSRCADSWKYRACD
jgi:SAM-dependent methyltransferase